MLDVDTSRASYLLTIGDKQISNSVHFGQTIGEEWLDIHSLELRQHWNEMSQLEIKIGDSHDFAFSIGDFELGTPVCLELGWWNDRRLIFEGELVSLEPDMSEIDRDFLILTAYDKSYLLKREYKESRFVKAENYLAAIRQIMKSHAQDALTYEVDDAASLTRTTWSDEENRFFQNQETDLMVLQSFADRLGYYTLTKGDVFYFVKDDYFARRQTEQWTFYKRPTMQQAEQVDNGLPLFRFQPRLSSIGQRTKVKVLAYTSVGPTGTRYGSAKLDDSEKDLRNFTKIIIESRRVVELKVFGSYAQSVNAARELAEGELRRRARDLVKGEAQTIGWAPLEVGQKHMIVANAFKGIGETFSKEYMITGVRHSLSSEGFFTEFDVSTDMVADVQD